MINHRIITIAGKPGSGKSSTANAVAKELGYDRFSSGDFMRAVARDRGLTLEELGTLAETDHSVDEDIDEQNRNAANEDRLVIDSRLAFHWIPDSFKVYLDLDLLTAAKRISKDHTEARVLSGEVFDTPEELAESLGRRLKSEQRRYAALYGINHLDLGNYDLVIDTGHTPLAEVCATIVAAYKKYCEQKGIEI